MAVVAEVACYRVVLGSVMDGVTVTVRLTARERRWLLAMPSWGRDEDDGVWIDGRSLEAKFDAMSESSLIADVAAYLLSRPEFEPASGGSMPDAPLGGSEGGGS